MKVEFTPAAVAQLVEISAYLRERHPGAAVRVATAIEATGVLLGTTPLIGRRQDVPEVRRKSVVSTPYVIYYTVLTDERIVRILAVLHGARQRPYRDA